LKSSFFPKTLLNTVTNFLKTATAICCPLYLALPCLAWGSQLLSLFGMRAAQFSHPADRAGNKILIYLPIPGNGKHRHALVLRNM
jgi:hypothetical protein